MNPTIQSVKSLPRRAFWHTSAQ